MRCASSAICTNRASASASEWTAIVRIPRRLAVRMMRQAISPRLAMRTEGRLSFTIALFPLHSEDAEAGLRHRRVERCRKRQSQDTSRLGGQDDPVVPESGCGIIGAALLLIPVSNRRLESFFLFSAPALPLRLQIVAPDGGEHARGLLAA